ncbi:MAG: hypothetical protein ACHP85_09430 [Burkholderiales bacterium]
MGPGVALQRLARVRVDPALVIPAGLLFCGGAYWLSLVAGWPALFPAAVIGLNLPLLKLGLPLAEDRPTLPGALPAVAVLLAMLAFTQYRANRVGADGSFMLDLGEHVDTAVHVGVSFELVAGYPPQVPGLAGVPMRYHVGSHLVRAAATRWAGIHPYDALSRFDVTLWAIALVLALRAMAHALGLGAASIRLAGFLPLLADLSFVPGLLLGSPNAAMKLGGNFVEALLFANSISPAMAAALAALVALHRAERGEGKGYVVLAGVLAAGGAFLKAFTGAQLLLSLALAWLVKRSRLLVAVAAPLAVAVGVLALGSFVPAGAEGVRVELLPFAPANPARVAFGLPPAHGLALAVSGVAWLVLSLGLRVAGMAPALRAFRESGSARASLAALALVGWPIAFFVSVSADPDYDESFYFLQASGLALYLLALPVLAGFARRSWLLAALVLGLTLPATFELVARRALAEPERIPAPTVRAMAALRAASCPGDVVLTRPGVAYVPPVVVLAGRRVPLASFIPYWRQFTTPETVARREAEVLGFFRAPDAPSALESARGMGARYVLFGGRSGASAADEDRPRSVRDQLDAAGALVPVHVEPGAAVYRLAPLAPAAGCSGAAPGTKPSTVSQ